MTMHLINPRLLQREVAEVKRNGADYYYDKIRNGEILPPLTYRALADATRDERMQWWREARLGLFIHYGLYAVNGRGEWDIAWNGTPYEEYDQQIEKFCPAPDCCKRWAEAAVSAGAKYMVLTTRHHDGFSLWDSKVNPYNSVQLGPHRDLVAEFVAACREYGLKVGFYSSVMDWKHPDAARCSYDPQARRRFLDYLEALNTELLTNYGPIDILWYDMDCPLDSEQAWEANIRNQKLRAICPNLIINDRSGGMEDFGTPEEKLCASSRDWESCLTFNRVSWGYTFSDQLKPYTYNVNNLIDTLSYCCRNKGNLLLNIGPAPDGSVPAENLPVLQQLGQWLRDNGEAVYGEMRHGETLGGSCAFGVYGGTQLSRISAKGNTVYIWQLIWPQDGLLSFYGFLKPPKRIRILRTGEEVPFSFKDMRILLTGLPRETPDPIANVPVFALDYDELPEYRHCGSTYHLDLF